MALAVDSYIFVVDAGKNDGRITYGIKTYEIISDQKGRAEYIKEINNDSIRKNNGSKRLLKKLRDKLDNKIVSSSGQEFGEELSTDNEESDNIKGRISKNDEDRGISILNSDNIQNSLVLIITIVLLSDKIR